MSPWPLRCLLALMFLALVWWPRCALALEPTTRDAVVAHNKVWDGFSYKENFTPSSNDEIVLLAGADSAIALVETLEYFWPLSRQIYVSFQTKRVELSGVLRIVHDGSVVAEIEPAAYTIHYPNGVLKGDGRMLWGAEAKAAYEQFKEDLRTFNYDYNAAERDRARYLNELRQSAAARLRGLPAADVVPPGTPPLPVARTVTEPATAFRIALEPGTYEMALYREGQPVAGTQKRLRILDPAQRDAIIADVVPEERWTRVLQASADNDRIFARAGATIYVALNHATRFDEADYAALTDPQGLGVAGKPYWARRHPVDAATLSVHWNGGTGADLLRHGLKARQTKGADLGYVIDRASADETADLDAFAVHIPDQGVSRGNLALPDGGSGDWQREIVVVQAFDPWRAFGLAGAPLILGMLLSVRRHRLERRALREREAAKLS